jgi:hypothetical protein
MNTYIVLYRQESVRTAVDAPFGFRCSADDSDHAEEQCINAYPDAGVVWVWEGDDMQNALDDYWNVADFNRG